ncbi:MAG: ankyrin repeat domain-containing protein, partial [Bdellovibrionia bacterium]
LYPTSIKLMHEIPSDLNNYSFVLDLAFENHNNEEVKNITESYLEVIFGKISSNEDLRSTLLSHCINKKQKVNINAFLQKYGRELVNKRSNIASVVGPLHEAVSTEDVEIVKLFLEAGADPNLKDYFGTTPLHYGALLDNFETIVPEILRAGGNIDAQDNSGKTILHYAVESRDLRRVKFVVSQGANLNLESETSATPLDLALRFGNQETVEYLRSRNAIQSSPVWVPGLRFFNSILSYFRSVAG